jgi:phosphatidylglycerophosphate synthase
VAGTVAADLALPGFVMFAGAAGVVVQRHRALRCGESFGAANGVTLARLMLVCLFAAAALVGTPLTPALAWIAFVGGLATLALDGLDGWVARRLDQASAFGARFDMEVDALFILVLSVLAYQSGKAGAWVLLSGAARYLYVAAGAVVPALRRPLYSSWRRKIVAVIQGTILVALLAPPVTPPVSGGLAAVGLALLIYSFAADIVWQCAGATASAAAAGE